MLASKRYAFSSVASIVVHFACYNVLFVLHTDYQITVVLRTCCAAMCVDQILENHNADLQHDADEAHAALTDFESKRDAFKLKVRQAAIRATTLMQWKLAVGLVQVERAKQDAKQVPPLSCLDG